MDETIKLLKPLRREDIFSKSIDESEEIMLYDSRHGLLQVLNKTAFEIWELCDGTHTIGDIVGLFVDKYRKNPDEISHDVLYVLQQFQEVKLLKVPLPIPRIKPHRED